MIIVETNIDASYPDSQFMIDEFIKPFGIDASYRDSQFMIDEFIKPFGIDTSYPDSQLMIDGFIKPFGSDRRRCGGVVIVYVREGVGYVKGLFL